MFRTWCISGNFATWARSLVVGSCKTRCRTFKSIDWTAWRMVSKGFRSGNFSFIFFCYISFSGFYSKKISIQKNLQLIDAFPRPKKKLNQPTEPRFSIDSNNCDMNYLKKTSDSSSPTNSIKLYATETPTTSHSHNEVMRSNVIRELLETEENYVKLLSSLCIGWVVISLLQNNINHTKMLINCNWFWFLLLQIFKRITTKSWHISNGKFDFDLFEYWEDISVSAEVFGSVALWHRKQ